LAIPIFSFLGQPLTRAKGNGRLDFDDTRISGFSRLGAIGSLSAGIVAVLPTFSSVGGGRLATGWAKSSPFNHGDMRFCHGTAGKDVAPHCVTRLSRAAREICSSVTIRLER